MAERVGVDREGGSKSKTSPRSGCSGAGREQRESISREGSPNPYSIQQYGFRIDGPLHGFSKDFEKTFSRAYRGYKRLVRLLANVAGVPRTLGPSDDAELFIHIYWAKKARIDTSNVLKSLEDGLFKQDRRIAAVHVVRHEHSGRECAEVHITIGRGHETQKDGPKGGGRGGLAPAQDGTSAAC